MDFETGYYSYTIDAGPKARDELLRHPDARTWKCCKVCVLRVLSPI